MVLVPAAVAPMVALLDGERTPSGIKAAFEVRYGTRLPPGFIEHFLAALQEAALLFGPAYAAARERVLADYRAAPFRQPALAGNGYPADPEALHQLLALAMRPRPAVNGAARVNGRLRGLITPHIDYARGGAEYARAWLPARAGRRRGGAGRYLRYRPRRQRRRVDPHPPAVRHALGTVPAGPGGRRGLGRCPR